MNPEGGIVRPALKPRLEISCGDGALANAARAKQDHGLESGVGTWFFQSLVHLLENVDPVEEVGGVLGWHNRATKPLQRIVVVWSRAVQGN